MSGYTVLLKQVPALRIASRRVTIPKNDQVPELLGKAFDEAYRLIRARGEHELMPCLALWHQGAEVVTNEDVEAAVPVARLFAGNERVSVYELPKTTVASVLHEGDYSGFPRAHAALLSWIEANGYRVLGGYREVYLKPIVESSASAVTEIQYPVERAAT